MSKSKDGKNWMDRQHEKQKTVFDTGELASHITDEIAKYMMDDLKLDNLLREPMTNAIISVYKVFKAEKENNKSESELPENRVVENLTTISNSVAQQINDILNTYHFMRNEFDALLNEAQEIEGLIFQANSIYAIYLNDYAQRRHLLILARAKCQGLIRRLTHVGNYIAKKKKNTDKYMNTSNDVISLSNMIKGMIISDDKKRKKHFKEYK